VGIGSLTGDGREDARDVGGRHKWCRIYTSILILMTKNTRF
jgi:hypothetical protein